MISDHGVKKQIFGSPLWHTAGADTSMGALHELTCSAFLFFSPSDPNASADNQR